MGITNNLQFDFWIKYLKFISLFFATMGVMWRYDERGMGIING